MKNSYFGLIVLCIPFAIFSIGFYGLQQNQKPGTRPLAVGTNKRTCEVHGVPLQKDIVPLSYGRVPASRESGFKASRSLFPNANRSVQGGCVIANYDKAEVLFCGQCRSAEQTWYQRRRQ